MKYFKLLATHDMSDFYSQTYFAFLVDRIVLIFFIVS